MLNPYDLIGIPYEVNGRGPDTYDCYGLIQLMCRELDGLELPDYTTPQGNRHMIALVMGQMHHWQPTEVHRGAIALFRVPGNYHCAYMLDKGSFIHTWEHSGGICIEPLQLWENRLVEFYDFTG